MYVYLQAYVWLHADAPAYLKTMHLQMNDHVSD